MVFIDDVLKIDYADGKLLGGVLTVDRVSRKSDTVVPDRCDELCERALPGTGSAR